MLLHGFVLRHRLDLRGLPKGREQKSQIRIRQVSSIRLREKALVSTPIANDGEGRLKTASVSSASRALQLA